jgi:hypothetical protein
VRHESRLEGIVEVRDESEIVNGHKSDQLEVLNQNPQRKKSDTSPDKEHELGQNNTNHYPIAVLGNGSEVDHHGISPVEQKRNTLVSLFGVELVGGDIVLEDPVLTIYVEGHVIRLFLEPEAFSVIGELRPDLNEETIRFLDEQTKEVGLIKDHSEVNHLVVVLELGKLEVSQCVVELVTSTLVVSGISPEEVEVVFQPGEVDVMGELDRSLRRLVNPVDCVVD